jgi:GAF domain-containing protein/HAMP domain-containing protein
MRNSLRVRLTIIFIGLAIGPLLLVGLILVQRSYTVEQEQALELQGQVAQRVSTELEAFLQDVGNEVSLLGREMRDLGEPDRAQMMSLLLNAFSTGPYRDVYEEFSLLDEQGQEQLRLSRQEIIAADELEDRSGRPEFEQVKASRETYFSPIRFDERTGEPRLSIAIPLSKLRSVQLSGVLVADVRFKSVGDLIAGMQVSEGQTIYVVDPAGRVVAHQETSIPLQDLHLEVPEQGGRQPGLTGTDAVLGVDQIGLGEQELTVVAERPVSEALASAIDTTTTIVLTIVVTLVMAVAVGYLVVRQIVRPIQSLSTTAQAISAGDLSQQVAVTSRDEIGTLGTAFNSMTAQLRESIDTLEERVVSRTQRLEMVAILSERLNTILDFDQLLLELVHQVKDTFGYYHAHVYVIDDAKQNLVMAAGAGEAGKQMKAKGHRIALDAPTSLVARAARTNQIVSVDNVREAPDWLPNPLLPDTYSEMAVPIVLEGQVVGVLDVQQDEVAGLDEGDANLLRSLANQVAVAIRNAHLFAEVESSLRQAREAQQRYVEQAWDRSRVARRGAGRVQYDLDEVTTLPAAAIAEARERALAHQELAVVALNGGQGQARQALVAPIKLQDIPIGELQLHGIQPDRTWSEAELDLIEAVVDQVAQVAESLRLLDDTQERAGRERLIGQVSDRLRRAPDMEALMQTAVGELARILGPDRTFVRLGSEAELGATQARVSGNGEAAEPVETTRIESDLTELAGEFPSPTNGSQPKTDEDE